MKKNDETGSEKGDITDTKQQVIQVERNAQDILDKHQQIYFEKRFKFLRGKEIYFKSQNMVKSTFKVVKQLNSELEECFQVSEMQISVTLEENPVHVETFEIQEKEEEDFSQNQSFISQKEQLQKSQAPKENIDQLITNEPLDLSEF